MYRALVDWFTDRLRAEKAIRDSDATPVEDGLFTAAESFYDLCVYKCTPFTKRRDPGNSQEEVSEEPAGETVGGADSQQPDAAGNEDDKLETLIKKHSVDFDSEFECGNLATAVRVLGREGLLSRDTPPTTEESPTPPPCSELHELSVHQEYDLRLSNDLFTTGNIQWYYFAVTAPSPPSAQFTGSSLFPGLHRISYPLTVRFNITNMMKSDALYNYGCRPATYSHRAAEEEYIGWTHAGFDVCYYKNDTSFVKKSKYRTRRQHHYTLSFSYTFRGPDTVYFAHSFPYTYTRLQRYLLALERDTRIATFIRRKMLCCTLANNRCDLLTITAPCQNPTDMENRPGVVITARVHPGESNSSFVMEGLLDFLTSEHLEAVQLRAAYVIKVVPMLNPDGVIHGNYRCSLAGCDLNRKYSSTDPALHPTICAVKGVISEMSQSRGVSLYIDIHGHSQRKNAFLYGCDPNQTNVDKITSAVQMLSPSQGLDKSVFCRIFPKILEATSTSLAQSQGRVRGYFSFEDSALGIQKSKTGTGRVVTWRSAGVSAAYTVEISFCGNGNNAEVKLIKTLAAHYKKKRSRLEQLKGTLNCYSDHLAQLGTSTKWTAELTNILRAGGFTNHYSEGDLMAMGTEICLAIHSYSNLDGKRFRGLKDCLKNIGDRPSSRPSTPSQQRPSCRPVDAATQKLLEGRNAVRAALLNQDKNRNAINGIQELVAAADILEPILHPAVVSVEVLEQVMSQHMANKVMLQLTPRLLCEIELRKEFRLLEDRSPSFEDQDSADLIGDRETTGGRIGEGNKQGDGSTLDSLECNFDNHFIGTKLFLYDIEEDMGSDSDPSGDEAPTSKLAVNAAFINLARFSKHNIAERIKLATKRSSRIRNKSTGVGISVASSLLSSPRRRNSVNAKDPDDAFHEKVQVTYGNGSLAPHRQAIAESLVLNRLTIQQAQQLQQPFLVKKALTAGPPVVKQTVKIRNICLDPELGPKKYHGQQTLSSGGAPKAQISSPSFVLGKKDKVSLLQSCSSPSFRPSHPSSTPFTSIPPRDSSKKVVMTPRVSNGDLSPVGQGKRFIIDAKEHVVPRHPPTESCQTSFSGGTFARNVVTVGDIASVILADVAVDVQPQCGNRGKCAVSTGL